MGLGCTSENEWRAISSRLPDDQHRASLQTLVLSWSRARRPGPGGCDGASLEVSRPSSDIILGSGLSRERASVLSLSQTLDGLHVRGLACLVSCKRHPWDPKRKGRHLNYASSQSSKESHAKRSPRYTELPESHLLYKLATTNSLTPHIAMLAKNLP
jgi:hypothetical protein